MYFEDSISWDKAELQENLDNGYITADEYDDAMADIETTEDEYYNGWY